MSDFKSDYTTSMCRLQNVKKTFINCYLWHIFSSVVTIVIYFILYIGVCGVDREVWENHFILDFLENIELYFLFELFLWSNFFQCRSLQWLLSIKISKIFFCNNDFIKKWMFQFFHSYLHISFWNLVLENVLEVTWAL